MTEFEQYPAYLPDPYKYKRWVGSIDMFAPQISVIAGPPIADIQEAMRDKSTVTLDLEYRTADMDDSDRSERIGPTDLRVFHVIAPRENAICFMSQGSLPFSGGNCLIWTWEYEDGGIGAGVDFQV